jgi:hypothetical protein
LSSQQYRQHSFRRLITLKPYGNSLLTPSAANWIFIARIIIIIMAFTEAISWGYLGSFFLSDPYRYFSAGITGSFIFLIIWAIDVTLVTLDRTRAYYEKRLYDILPDISFQERLREFLGFGSRWIIIISSLFITAPFLTQLIFSNDIKKQLDAETTSIIKMARENVERKYVERIENLQTSLLQERTLYSDEVSGRTSGRFGQGPVAKEIETRIKVNEAELENIQKQLYAELHDFNTALENKDFRELQNRWGIDIPENSPIKRGELLAKIMQYPAYMKTELAVRAFLVFLFLSLLILKLFEPKGMKLYLSEALQLEWQRYKAGSFNQWLAPQERSDVENGTMTPYRFEDLMVNFYPVIRSEDLIRRQSASRERDADDAIATLVSIKHQLQEETSTPLNNIHEELALINRELKELARRKASILIDSNFENDQGKLIALEQEGAFIESDIVCLQEKKHFLEGEERNIKAKLQAVEASIDEIRYRRMENALNRGKASLSFISEETAPEKSINTRRLGLELQKAFSQALDESELRKIS